MRRQSVIFLTVFLMVVLFLTGCGNSVGESNQTDQVQEDSAESKNSYEYVTEGGKFTQSVESTLENIDKRMDGECAFHTLQDGLSVYVRWVDDQEINTVVSCNKSDGKTPVDSADEVPGGLVIGTQQPTGELNEFTINGIVYVLQTLNADLASDNSLYDKVNGMATEVEAMKKDLGEGGFSEGTIGDFDVTLLTQKSEDGMLVLFMIDPK